MTDRAIMVIAVCAFLSICVICLTVLLLQQGKNRRKQYDNDTCKSMVESIVNSKENYTLSVGGLTADIKPDNKSITLEEKGTQVHSVIAIGSKILEYISQIMNYRRNRK